MTAVGEAFQKKLSAVDATYERIVAEGFNKVK
jgi:hypothetical protein